MSASQQAEELRLQCAAEEMAEENAILRDCVQDHLWPIWVAGFKAAWGLVHRFEDWDEGDSEDTVREFRRWLSEHRQRE